MRIFDLFTMTSVFTNTESWINNVGGLLFSITVILSVFWGTIKFLFIPHIKKLISENQKDSDAILLQRTKQIQPDANGGKSLSDVNKKVDRVEKTVGELAHNVDIYNATNELKHKHTQETLDRIEKSLNERNQK